LGGAFKNGQNKTLREFRAASAHEFGHALGVNDAFGFGTAGGGFTATEFGGDYHSIFACFNRPVTRLDLELALNAHRTNTWQTWHNNRDLVNRYGIRR